MSHEPPNNTVLIPSIPLELIELLIIPYSAVSWLRVSKKYNAFAINYVVNDSSFLSNPNRAVTNAVFTKNYALLDVLISDERYRAKHILSQVMQMFLLDKSANMVLLKYCYGTDWIRVRIVEQAVKKDWIDHIEFLLNHKNIFNVEISSFNLMSRQMFELLASHPKLNFKTSNIKDVASNTRIPNSVKVASLLKMPNISMSEVIETCACHEEFVDALLLDQRVKESVTLQRLLWTRLIGTENTYERINQYFDKCAKVRMILDKKLLAPSIESNFPLMRVFDEKNFTQDDTKIAQMLLDDDRVVLTLLPYSTNLIYIAIARPTTDLTAKIKFILSHPKYNKEWFESVMTYLLDQQSLLKTIDNTTRIFEEHEFDQFLSEEIRARAPKEIKRLQRMHPYYYNYFDEPGFYSDEEDEENCDDDGEDPVDAPVE